MILFSTMPVSSNPTSSEMSVYFGLLIHARQSDTPAGTKWTINAQYLRAGSRCSSVLMRGKSSTDDEYHHEDPLGVFGVITGANATTLSSNVYDAFVAQQYVANNARIAQPIVCYKTLSEPGLLIGNGGRGVVVPSRGFQVMGKKPVPVMKHPCKPAHHTGHHGLPWHTIIACLAEGIVEELANCIRFILANASSACLACLGAALIGCIAAPEACAGDIGVFLDLCELDACDSGLLSCLTADLPKNIVKFVACVGILHSL